MILTVLFLINFKSSFEGNYQLINCPFTFCFISACVQVSSGHSSGVRAFLENFLTKWKFDDEKHYAVTLPAAEKTDLELRNGCPKLEVDEYVEIVEFYALTLLGRVLNDVDHAVLWIEQAELPEEARQVGSEHC